MGITSRKRTNWKSGRWTPVCSDATARATKHETQVTSIHDQHKTSLVTESRLAYIKLASFVSGVWASFDDCKTLFTYRQIGHIGTRQLQADKCLCVRALLTSLVPLPSVSTALPSSTTSSRLLSIKRHRSVLLNKAPALLTVALRPSPC